MLFESGLRSHAPVVRLAPVDVVVSATQTYQPPGDLPVALPERARVPAGLAQQIAALPGVTGVIADQSFPAAVVDRRGRVVPAGDPGTGGHGWASTGLLARPRTTGTPPAGPREVALSTDLAAAAGIVPGQTVSLVVGGRRGTYRVSAVVAPAGGIFFADPVARQLAGHPGLVDLIAVGTAASTPDVVAGRVRALVPAGTVVSTGAARGDVETPAAAAARRLLPALAGSLAGVTLLMVGFIVAGALAVSIAGQRRDLALLRAVGATPRQIRRLSVAQAALVTAAVLLPGIALGYLLAEQFRQVLVSTGMLPPGLPLTFGPLPALAAALLVLLVVAVAAWSASWPASRMPATEAVAQSRTEPREPAPARGLAGLLLLVGALVVAVTPLLARSQAGAAGTVLAGILAAIGLALLAPAVLRPALLHLARVLPARASASTWLAVANSHGYALRVAGAVSTLALAVVFPLTYAFTQTTLLQATSTEVQDAARTRLSITAPALGGLPTDLADQVTGLPGVRAAAAVSTTTVLWPHRVLGDTEVESGPALVLDPAGAGVLDLDVRSGSLSRLRGATVAVDAGVVRSRQAPLGSRVTLILGDGVKVTARVVATYGRGLGFGPVVLSRDLVRPGGPAAGHTGTGLDQSLVVRTDTTGIAHRALSAYVAAHPGLVLGDQGPGGPAGRSGIAPELWINIAVLGALLGYLLLGLANKLVASTLQRRTEIAALQLIGATPAQIRAMMRREAGLVAAAALGAGLLLATPPLLFLSLAFLGRPWPAGPVWLVPVVIAGVAAIAWLTVEIPTRRILRIPPETALARA